MKAARYLVTALAVVALSAPLTALWFLGHSSSVLNFLIAQIPSRFGSIERLEIREVRGSLAGGFAIGVVELDHDVFHLRLRKLQGRVRLLPLFWQAIELRGLQAERLDILPQPRNRPPPQRRMRFLPGLLTLNADEVRVARLVITPASVPPTEFRDIALDVLLRSETLQFRALRARLGKFAFAADGRLLAADPLGLEVDLRTDYQPQRGPRWRATAAVDGTLAAASVQARLLEPFAATVEAGALRLLLPWSLRGEAALREVDLRRFGGPASVGLIDGRLDLALDRDGYRARGSVLPAALAAGSFEVDVDARYAQGVLTLRRFALAHPNSGTSAELEGRVSATTAGPMLDLAGGWQQLRWPLAAPQPTLRSERGRFTVRGSGPYALTAQGAADLGALPPLQIALGSTLERGRLRLDQVDVLALGGSGRLSGEVAWQGAPTWRLAGAVRGLDPGQYRTALPGRLDFDLEARGRGFGRGSTVDLDIKNITGRLRGARARGGGRLEIAGDTLRLARVELAAGGLNLALDGALSPQRRDLDFRLEASDLGVLVEGGRGELRAAGRVRGPPAALQVRLQAEGRDLALRELRIGSLAADIDLDPRGGVNADARARVEASALQFIGQSAERLRLDIAGNAQSHTLAIDLTGPELAVTARGDGTFDAAGWQQRWPTVGLRLPRGVQLALESPLALALTADTLRVEPFCMRGAGGTPLVDGVTLCGSGTASTADWNLTATVAALPLAAVLPNPTPRARYEGSLHATANLRSAAAGPPQGTLDTRIVGARLRWRRASGQDELIPLGSGSLRLESDAQGLRGKLALEAGGRGRASGSLSAASIPRADASWRDLPLQATLRADSTALALLHLYVPEIDRSAGDLSLDLEVGGTLGTPLVNGVVRLENGELDFYQVNLALREVNAEARLRDNGLVLNSQARAGRGRLAAAAELTWTDGQPSGELRLQGDNLTVLDVPEARIEASPDLRLRIEGRKLTASGSVLIPRARLVPTDLSGATLTSADEILAGSERRDPATSFEVLSQLRLTLGERVTVDSFGLSGRLAGTLNVVTGADGSSRGSGELGITEGKYAALGRRLDIERGRLIFAGGLLADPGVELRATKEFPEVRAGVNVRGTLRAPRLSFFSEPSLPQSQVVSLILAGGTLESAQSSALANSGRDALLAQGGAILAQQLGQRIGIDDVGIEQNLANETSLVFGKYLSSRLYVSYGVSLAEAINTLKLRYSIDDRWTLRTEVGKEASAELVYTVETN